MRLSPAETSKGDIPSRLNDDDFFVVGMTHSHQSLSFDVWVTSLLAGMKWPSATTLMQAVAKAEPQYFFGAGYMDPVGSLTRRLMCYTD